MAILGNSFRQFILLWAISFALMATGTAVAGVSSPSLPAEPPVSGRPDDLPMQPNLWIAEQLARQVAAREVVMSIGELRAHLAERKIFLDAENMVQVEIVGPAGADAAADLDSLPEQVGGRLHLTWENLADAWVPIDRLSVLARLLPNGYFIHWAHPDTGDHEGPGVVNSATYVSAGRNGAGRIIAVLDSGYAGFTTSANAGNYPPAARRTHIDMTGSGFPGTSNHGTGVVESAFAHAPGAHYLIYRIGSIAQTAAAVNDAISRGAHIATHSISRYNTGWADNTGTAVAFANNAADNGMLFFTSAGNRARQHWRGTMNPGTNDWHNFGSNETIRINMPPGAGGTFALQWNTSAGSFNYDLVLYNDDISQVLASSVNSGTNVFESFGYTNNTSGSQWVRLAVRRRAGGNTQLQVFMHGSGGAGNFNQFTTPGSITSPSNSTRANVISVGAVHWNNFDSPNNTGGIIMSYSSQGPTNSGNIRPDLVGPTNVSTTCCGGSFGGTSSATPNAAGAAAALWSAHPTWSASAVRWMLYEKASYWKNWGPGLLKSNTYGFGGVALYDYQNNQVWLARGFGNTTNANFGPFYTLQGAFNTAPANSNILVLPGTYAETLNLSGKSANIVNIHNQATFTGN